MTTGRDPAGLSERQAQVVAQVAEGRTTKEMAASLGVSDRAVTAVLSRLFRRYGVANRAGLIAALLADTGERDRMDFAAYQNAPFVVAATAGPEHRYLFVNDQGAAMAGLAATTMVGRTVRDILPDVGQQFHDTLDLVFRTGRSVGVPDSPIRFPNPDGTFRDTRVNAIFQPLRDASGTVTGILHVGTELPD